MTKWCHRTSDLLKEYEGREILFDLHQVDIISAEQQHVQLNDEIKGTAQNNTKTGVLMFNKNNTPFARVFKSNPATHVRNGDMIAYDCYFQWWTPIPQFADATTSS